MEEDNWIYVWNSFWRIILWVIIFYVFYDISQTNKRIEVLEQKIEQLQFQNSTDSLKIMDKIN
jgi:cell division protein FtsL